MELSPAKYKRCKSCKSVVRQIADVVYGCDECKKKISFKSNGKSHHDHLEITVFMHNQEAQHLHFCSWKCVFKKLKTVKSDNFISLPFLTFESDVVSGQTVDDFLACIR